MTRTGAPTADFHHGEAGIPDRVAIIGPMPLPTLKSRALSLAAPVARFAVLLLCGASALLLALAAVHIRAQQTAPAPGSQAAPTPPSPATPQPAGRRLPLHRLLPRPRKASQLQRPWPRPAVQAQLREPGSITEDELRKQLEGKELFLRGGYLDNTLTFNEHGALIGHSPQGSYTLSGIRIDKVRLLKHKVELTGSRYALHFLGALPYEDPTKAVDRVNITPRKKEVRITIDRELVVKPKQKKNKGKAAKRSAPAAKPAPASGPKCDNCASRRTRVQRSASPAPEAGTTEANEAQAEMAAAPEAERPADPKSVTTTLSPAHANKVLEDALNNVFAKDSTRA